MAMSVKHLRAARRRQEIEWSNTESGVEVRLTPEALRPGTPWSPDLSDLIVIAGNADENALRLTWSLTAEGFGQQFTGETTLTVNRDTGVNGLYAIYFAVGEAKGDPKEDEVP